MKSTKLTSMAGLSRPVSYPQEVPTMALVPSKAVEVDNPLQTYDDSVYLGLPGEKVVQAQPANAFETAVDDDNVVSPAPAGDTPAVITFTKSALSVAVGSWVQLFVNFDPKYTGNKNIAWSSATPATATVDANGVVTGVADGDVVITATPESDGAAAITATVTVGEGEAEPVKTIAGKTIDGLTGGQSVPFSDMFTVTNGTVGSDLTYVVAPSSAGSVNSGGVLALLATASGTVTVTATAKSGTTIDGSPATCTLTNVVEAGTSGDE